MSPEEVVGAFEKAGSGLEHIRAVFQNDKTLNLYPDSWEAEANLRKQESEIRNILQLSERCKALWDQYLAVALNFQFEKTTVPRPDEYKNAWSEVNGVNIVRAYWTYSQLILSLGSLADAVNICKKPSVFLNGRAGNVR